MTNKVELQWEPSVSFASDMEGDLHMFSEDTDANTWSVFVITKNLEEVERAPSSQFFGYRQLVAGEHCWWVDDVAEAMFIEIRRGDSKRARAVHPRWEIWRDRYAKSEDPLARLDHWDGIIIQIAKKDAHHKPSSCTD